MAHTLQELKGKTVAELREIAKGLEHEAVKGYTQMNKDHLLTAVCKALGIDTFIHHHAVGTQKLEMRAKIRTLKKQRDEILAAKDHAPLRGVLDQIHDLKRRLRKAMV
jgi:hypothetical protein